MEKKKTEMSKGAKIGIVSGVVLLLFIAFACGLGAGDSEEKTEVKEKVVERIVYENDPRMLDEMFYHVDEACSFAYGYTELFEITENVAHTLDYTDIHHTWYTRKAEALRYMESNCELVE